MGKGMATALELVEEVKTAFRQNGIHYTRPWIFLMSDGEPTDAGWEQVAKQCAEAVQKKKVLIFPIAVPASNGNVPERSASALKAFAGPDSQVYQVSEPFFRPSASLSTCSRAPGAQVAIELPPIVLSV